MVKSFKMDTILRPIDDSTNPLLDYAYALYHSFLWSNL